MKPGAAYEAALMADDTANAELVCEDSRRIGRQRRAGVRLTEGRRIVAAQVSLMRDGS